MPSVVKRRKGTVAHRSLRLKNAADILRGDNNFLANVSDTTKLNSVTSRIDHMINDANRIYFRFNYIATKIISGQVYPTAFADFRSNEQRTKSAAYAANWTRNVKSNLINDLRFNFTTRSNFVEASSGNSDPKLGIPGVEALWFPAVTAAGISGLGQANWRLQTPIPGYQAINHPNRANFSNPGGSRGASDFGRVSSTLQGSERIVQLSLRLEF